MLEAVREKAKPGTLCELCDTAGRGKVAAAYVLLGTHVCAGCEAAADDPLHYRPRIPKRIKSRAVNRTPPPKSETVDIAAVLHGRGMDWSPEWLRFFTELADLPMGKAKACTPRNGEKLHTLDFNIRRSAKKYGLSVRVWNDKKRLYVALRDKSFALKEMRKLAIKEAEK